MLNTHHVEGALVGGVGGVLVARLKCEKLGEYESSVVQTDLTAAAKESGWRVAVDFAQVELISSVGLGLIVSLNKAAKTNRGRFVLFNLNANLTNLFKITRLDSGLLIKQTEADAVAAAKA
ncbi:hypothetical protein BH11PLA1_BH11PLA1_00580 [soil metagenome]